MYKIVIPGRPYTKKNSPRILRNSRTGRPFVKPSANYEKYEKEAGKYIPYKFLLLNRPLRVKCLYYMPTRHKVDLANLLEATCDILVHYGMIEDDNARIVASHDGSRVFYDPENPRAEIYIYDLGEDDGES